jgi:hypothetical protein
VSAPEGVDAKAGHERDEDAAQQEAEEGSRFAVELSRAVNDPGKGGDGERQEEEADDLVPDYPQRADDCGQYVSDELARVGDGEHRRSPFPS